MQSSRECHILSNKCMTNMPFLKINKIYNILCDMKRTTKNVQQKWKEKEKHFNKQCKHNQRYNSGKCFSLIINKNMKQPFVKVVKNFVSFCVFYFVYLFIIMIVNGIYMSIRDMYNIYFVFIPSFMFFNSRL